MAPVDPNLAFFLDALKAPTYTERLRWIAAHPYRKDADGVYVCGASRSRRMHVRRKTWAVTRGRGQHPDVALLGSRLWAADLQRWFDEIPPYLVGLGTWARRTNAIQGV